MNAASIAVALPRGHKSGAGWMACCPSHEDRNPSLSIRDAEGGKVLVHCHAGCSQGAVIAELKSKGLWPQGGPPHVKYSASHYASRRTESYFEENKRTEAALSIWQAAKPPGGTLIETYLRSRGLRLPATSTLRFQTHLKHPSGDSWPAMIALVTRGSDSEPLAIHRTFLARNGSGKAPVDSQKMMLGPCHGGAVRLAEPSDVLMIGEGIETCLAAMQERGHPVWAALSTSGLRALDLPKEVRDVIVLADGDDPGETAARDCALRWKRDGRRVRIARPPKGMDFNDMLVGRVTSLDEERPQ